MEALRQPLEDGVVTISRAAGSITFPARFLLLTAANPCPCGFLGHPGRACSCLPGSILRYRHRLSGPLLDRIDLHVDVPPVEQKELITVDESESSVKIRDRVRLAREIQLHRLVDARVKTNGEMSTAEIKKYCRLTDDASDLLKQAIVKMSLSARSYFKIIKISQTIADLIGALSIQKEHIAEALQYRARED